MSAACVVANGVRETLSSLARVPVAMRLFAPSIPAPHAWSAILHDAHLYRVRGSVADAAIVLRPGDAVALAAMLFGESSTSDAPSRALSAIERDVIDRMMDAIAVNLDVVCGVREGRRVERVGEIAGFVTYFELLVSEPLAGRIGIALSRDPAPAAGSVLDVAHLAGLPLTAQASIEVGKTNMVSVTRIAVGSVVPLPIAALNRCVLTAQGHPVARGNCGVSNGRYAFLVEPRRDPT
ncbi:MAG: FliM/FliN family flagellar motor switch protein [Candidatus Eremiobacteraeota bacterium]|nr:FliM/FliN family flagellar motor switch protein [Candidatus Eremiobacteraeota bacterium]